MVLFCKSVFTHCYDVEMKNKNTEREQVRCVLPQRAKGTQEWSLKSQMEEFSR